ncbi:unnamed protein product, partial [marine sediment metagenome]
QYKNINECDKLNLTFGLLFIYPSYKTFLDETRNDYIELLEFFRNKLTENLQDIIVNSIQKRINQSDIETYLSKKPPRSNKEYGDILSENLFRGC